MPKEKITIEMEIQLKNWHFGPIHGLQNKRDRNYFQVPSVLKKESMKQALSLWSGSTDSKTLDYQRTNPSVQFSSVQLLSRVRLFATPWIAARQASLSITSSGSLLKFMPIESVMPSSHVILCRPLLLLPPIPPSIRVFSNQSTLCMRWPKYWSSGFSISPSNEHPGLISFRMDWLDLLAVQRTPKSLLQHHSSKASIFQRSAFFTVQLSLPYMTTVWKNHSLDQMDHCWQSNVSAF